MNDEKAQRFDDALSSLVAILVPAIPGEDEDALDDRQDDALDLARSIIDSQGTPGVLSDVQHAADLIKKKLHRDHASPEHIVRFSNLYSRLLTQPVLSQKWAILYLLYQLAESGSDGYGVGQSRSGLSAELHDDPGGRVLDAADDDETFRDAFAGEGLPRFPSQQPQQTRQTSVLRGDSRDRPHRRREGQVEKDAEPAVQAPDDGRLERPSEAALLRDLPFTLQGLSANHLKFSSPGTLDLPPNLPLPLISILHTLAEPSLLYRSLSDFVESHDDGLIGQSLRSAIGSELRHYLGLISTLESEIRGSLASAAGDATGAAGVTLKRCVIWTRDATMGLRLMSSMVEEAKSKKGGQLISRIHRFATAHGDPFVSSFAERMLSHMTKPFYDMLRQWVYDGELLDPYHEFFVLENTSRDLNEDPRRAAATSVWEEKYKLDEGMIPSIITTDFAQKIFLIGKSLNFIRYSCGDSAWVEAHCKAASRELVYGDTATLETSIDEAHKTTMARLLHLMDQKFKLFAHLDALKRYLLLGQGDFVALLMESLSSNLDRPAGSQYRHTLTAQLEHAIRNSNAQYDHPDILRRLDARLTEMEKGDTGWDVFTLEYKVDAPVDVIITSWANRQYLKIFNLLWRVKRVEFGLGTTWRRSMTGARGVLSVIEDAKLGADWKSARCTIAEMIHFVNQLQYYILFEVIESSWDSLQSAINQPNATLDDLISAHTKYLKAITHKGLLGSVRTNSQGQREDVFTSQLHELLKTMLAYKDAVDGLYSFSVTEFTRRQELAAKIETRTAQGKWGLSEKDELASHHHPADDLASPASSTNLGLKPSSSGRDSTAISPLPTAALAALGLSSSNATASEENMLHALRKRLTDLSTDFRTRVNNLLGDLAVQPDVDMKFLGVVMNFNDVYTPRKRRGHHRAPGPGVPPSAGGGGSGTGVASAEKKLPTAETGSNGADSVPVDGGDPAKDNVAGRGAIATASKVLEKGKGKAGR